MEIFNKEIVNKAEDEWTVCGLRFTKVASRKSQKKWEQGHFPTPIIHYQLSIIHYFFTTLRMVTPCGTVIRSV